MSSVRGCLVRGGVTSMGVKSKIAGDNSEGVTIETGLTCQGRDMSECLLGG